MIYLYEFMKGAAFALLIFCLAVLFINEDFSFESLLFGIFPGLCLLFFALLLIKNYELSENQNFK